MRGVVREALASVRSQPAPTLLTFLVIAGMIAAVTLTSGRSIAAEQQVLDSIDSVGTRSIVVRAERDAGLTTAFLDRIGAVDGVMWVGAFSQIVDGRNSALPDADSVPVRYAYTPDPSALGIPMPAQQHTAYASAQALDALGMPYGNGAIQLTTGETIGAAAATETPTFLAEFEPLALIPAPATGVETVALAVVIAERPELVAPLTDVVTSLLALDDPQKATVTTSRTLAELRAIVETQLSSFSRGLVLVLVGVAALLVAALQAALVVMRRKDFGRRRALGASRTFIVALLLAQTALVAIGGIVAGAAVAHVVLIAGRDPVPGFAFVGAISALTLTAALAASLAPAVVASRREPIRELRIP